MSLFFMGLHPTWQRYKFLPDGINTMFSASAFTARFLKDGKWPRWRFFPFAGRTWADGGGFNLLNLYGEYPFTVANWMNLVAFLGADYCATLDYPCEPDISRQLGLMTNEDRLQATVERARECLEYSEMLDTQIVPVIQGFSLGEYRRCIDLHSRAGTIREYMAVGSMCRRLSSNKLHELIPGIYSHARQAGVKRLHFFGLKADRALGDLSEFIWSRDSAAVLDSRNADLRKQRKGRRFPRGQAEKQLVVADFLKTLEKMELQYLK